MIDGSIFVFFLQWLSEWLPLGFTFMICYDFWELKYKMVFFRHTHTQAEVVCKNQKALHERKNKNEATIYRDGVFFFIHFYLFLMVSISFNSFHLWCAEWKQTKNKQTMIKCKNMYPLVEGTKLEFHRLKAPVDLYAYLKLLLIYSFKSFCCCLHIHAVFFWLLLLLLQFIHFYRNNLSISFYFAHNISIKWDRRVLLFPLFLSLFGFASSFFVMFIFSLNSQWVCCDTGRHWEQNPI